MRLLLLGTIATLSLLSCANRSAQPATASSANSTKVPAVVPIVADDSLLQLKDNPSRDIAHESFLRGLAWRNANKAKIAEPFYKRALANEPGNRFLAFDLVEILIENGKNAEALRIAQKALGFEGENTGREYYLLARLHRESGNIDSAKVYYEKVVQVSPDHFRALYEYSVVLEMQQDFKNLARIYDLLIPLLNYPRQMVDKQLLLLKLKGNDSLVVDFLANAYAVRPDSELGQQLADALLEQKRYDEAYDLAEQLVVDDSNSVESLRNLVRVAIRAGKGPEAVAAQKRLFAADSVNLDELEKVGMLEFETNQMDSALVRFKHLVSLRSSDHLAWFYLSNIYAIKKDSTKSMDAIQRAIALKPDAVAYRNQQAALFAQAKNFDKAHQVLDAALVYHKDHPLVMQYKANTYIREAILLEEKWPLAGSVEAKKARELRLTALDWFKKAYQQDTLAGDVLFSYASNLERLDSVTAAVNLFNKLLSIDPANHQGMNYLGYTLVERKIDQARGARLIDSALAMSPGNEAYLDSKAWALYMQGDFKGARQILQQLVTEFKTDDVTIWEHLAEACEADKDTKAAHEAWKHVLRHNPRHAKALKATSLKE